MNEVVAMLLLAYCTIQGILFLIWVIGYWMEGYYDEPDEFNDNISELVFMKIILNDDFNLFGKCVCVILMITLAQGLLLADFILLISLFTLKLMTYKPNPTKSGVPKHKEITIEPAERSGELKIIHSYINTLLESSQKRHLELIECKTEIEILKQEIENLKDLICINK